MDNQRPGARIPGPTVLLLVAQLQYSKAVDALHERPQDPLYEEYNGDTALHIMCRRPSLSVRVADAILAVDPTMAGRPNQQGFTPLHFACANLSCINSIDRPDWENLVLKLITACPCAVTRQLPRNLQSKTPFHLACAANASASVLTAMLTVSPTLATQPLLQVSETSTAGYPLFLLWHAVKSSDDWSKMELLLRAATGAPIITNHQRQQHSNTNSSNSDHDTDGPDEHFDVLNAACRTNPCPRDYLSLLLQRFPNRASWTDREGLLPLHHVILNARKNGKDGTEKFLIQRLVQLYPTGASCPFTHRYPPLLPLQYLISDSEANWPEYGISELVDAYPEALRIPDPRTGLVPALASAPFAIHSRLHLTATYKLLLKSPEVFETWSRNKRCGCQWKLQKPSFGSSNSIPVNLNRLLARIDIVQHTFCSEVTYLVLFAVMQAMLDDVASY
ncbi:ankyrin repeat domain protein [Nitzschia inconspicua]|uniref:Ankyrin repeat domain protein n=1 Tax=Nitzschia inconspicua TaxID=303405 RepID=A0A9K3KVK0_9STRA|nr:ankyrin repeat domain protein [Nitzschia inconspicua]